MGDTFEVVVDVDATATEAPHLARGVIDWLTAEGIIAESSADHAGTVDGRPYHPGPNPERAVARAVQLADGGPMWFRYGELKVSLGRTVFVPVQGEPGPAVCPMCGYSVALTDSTTGGATGDWGLFEDALTDWHEGGPGLVACPNNGSLLSINEWQWQGQWPIAVGHLGFTFWNWPPLGSDFVDRIGGLLDHRTVVTRGKL